MPRMRGIEVEQRIRKLGHHHRLRSRCGDSEALRHRSLQKMRFKVRHHVWIKFGGDEGLSYPRIPTINHNSS